MSRDVAFWSGRRGCSKEKDVYLSNFSHKDSYDDFLGARLLVVDVLLAVQ
jgi:hypothetical protein